MAREPAANGNNVARDRGIVTEMHASTDRDSIALYRPLYGDAAANSDHVTTSAHHVDGATDTNYITDLLVLFHDNTAANLDTVTLRARIKRGRSSNQSQ